MSTRAPDVRTGPAGRSLGRELVGLRSLALLLLALGLAAGFAALGQWQLQRAVQNGSTVPRQTETVRPLSAVARPAAPQTDASVGQLVSVVGRTVPGEHVVVADRLNGGRTGAWVTARVLTDDGAQLAVALGWAPSESAARAVARRLDVAPDPATITGRYVDGDPAAAPASGPVGRLPVMSPPMLLNLWRPIAGDPPVYAGFVTLRQAPAGLTTIDSPAPAAERELNLLNVLYAGEWALFALLALYLWYRLVRDRWELARADGVDPMPAEESDEPVGAGRSTTRA